MAASFTGGKGVATFSGILVPLLPIAALVYALIWLWLLLIVRISSVAGIAAAISAPLSAALIGRIDLMPMLFGFALLVHVEAHRANIAPAQGRHRAAHRARGLSADLVARLRLIRRPSIGPVSFRQLLARFGSAEAALAAVPDLGGAGRRALAQSVQPRQPPSAKSPRSKRLARVTLSSAKGFIRACLPSSTMRRRC